MFFLLYYLLICVNLYFIEALSSHPLVLIVSYDAFRHNYLEKGVTPTIAKLRNEGCWADYLDNVFVTKTFPNHVSISTGYYPETHGVMGNSFFDPKLGKELDYSYEMYHYKEKAVPIWIENERQGNGRHSGVMMWPGNEYNYSGIVPTFHQTWDSKVEYETRVDTLISWFKHPTTPVNLVLFYHEQPDHDSHAYGPESQRTDDILKIMDLRTKYLLEKLEVNGLRQKVNLFLVSDHGMLQVTKKDIIDLRPFVNESLYNVYETSPVLHVYPKKGAAVQVYEGFLEAQKKLGGFRVYKQADLPAEWHYSNSRTPPILLVAEPPHVFHDFYKNIEYYEKADGINVTNETTFGVHGYDNKFSSMKPFFIASGPAIKNKTHVLPFRTVDLFSIWSEMLGFPEAAKNTDGNLAVAKSVLQQPHTRVSSASIAAGLTGGFLVLFAMGVTVYFLHKKLQHKYQILLQSDQRGGDESRQLLYSDEEEEA